jgi:alpha-L-rhamnosidase
MVLLVLTAAPTEVRAGIGQGLQPFDLTTEHTSSPLDIDIPQPRLAWKLAALSRGAVQTAYRIQVASSTALLAAHRADEWETGKVASANQNGIPYAGLALQSNSTYFWRVQVWDKYDQPSAWSPPAQFETGLLRPQDWTAQWIGRSLPSQAVLGQQPPAPLLRTVFTLSKEVVRARLRLVGLGYYEAYMNGARVGDHVLDPAQTQYDKTALYVTHDVSVYLRRGANAIGVILGRGAFSVLKASATTPDTPGASEPRLLAQLDIQYIDGSTARVISDGRWRMADSPIIDDLRAGEHYDARAEQPGWTMPDFDDSMWEPAPVHPAPLQQLRAQALEPVTIVDTLQPTAVTSPKPGLWIYDFGTQTAGWERITVQGQAGLKVTLKLGERLNADGTVFMVPSVMFGGHSDTYILKGNGELETWEPRFTRHAFRYIEVSSTPVPPLFFRVEARVNHNLVPSRGEFGSSNILLNKMHTAMRTALLNNFWGIPTDSPWRDRHGWTADNYLYFDAASLNFGVQRFYKQWLRAFQDAQAEDGSLPIVVPSGLLPASTGIANDPAWAGTYILIVWKLYLYYGDTSVLSDNYAAMKRYLDKVEATITPTGYIWTGLSFGDWASPGSCLPSAFCSAPEYGWDPASGIDTLRAPLLATAYVYHEARALAAIARVLRNTRDATRYDALADNVGRAFNARFFDPVTQVYHTEIDVGYRQTSNLLPLALGLVPPDQRKAVLDKLIADIHAHDDHLNTGTSGTKLILPVLTENGYGDLAYTITTQTTYPSWGYWFTQGNGNLYEMWEIDHPIGTQSHPFLGSYDDWFYQHLAGIKPAAPGYAKLRIKPFVPAGLNHVHAQIDTVRGKVASSWVRSPDGLALRVEIPPNTSAEVAIPASSAASVGVIPSRAEQLKFLRYQDGYAVFAVGSGSYVFWSARVGAT